MKLTVSVPPSANEWHRVVNGRPILSAVARKYAKDIALWAMAHKVEKIAAPTEIAVNILWFRARRAGDVDKRGAVLLDALQGVCFDNDSQIKRYGIVRDDSEPEAARMEITIEPIAA